MKLIMKIGVIVTLCIIANIPIFGQETITFSGTGTLEQSDVNDVLIDYRDNISTLYQLGDPFIASIEGYDAIGDYAFSNFDDICTDLT